MSITSDDRVAIVDFLARTYRQMDEGEIHAYADAFTEDGVVTNPVLHMVGRDEIYRRLVEVTDVNAPVDQHWLGNVAVSGDGDNALAQAFMLVVEQKEGDKPIVSAAYRMRFALRRVAGAWRIRELTVTY